MTLKIVVISSSEMSVPIRTVRRYIPEDSNIHNYLFVNLKSHRKYVFNSLGLEIVTSGAKEQTNKTPGP
jgi:hypothetical protein